MKTNNLKTEIRVPEGVWTPNAKVLCYNCHGNRFSKTKYNPEVGNFEDRLLNEDEFNEANSPKIVIDDCNAITKCDKCNTDIQLRKEIATENNLVSILKEHGLEAYMAQVGGMNSTAQIPTKDKNGHVWITYNNNNKNEWLISVCDEEGYLLDDYYETYDTKDVLEYIFKLKEKAII